MRKTILFLFSIILPTYLYSAIPDYYKNKDQWEKLYSNWCSDDRGAQSPVNIDTQTFLTAANRDRKPEISHEIMSFHFAAHGNHLIDTGHSILVSFAIGSTALIGGQKYVIKQLHFHSQSEHTVNNKRYPLEMHIVMKNKKNQFAVVGVLFKLGKQNEALKKILKNFQNDAHQYDSSKPLGRGFKINYNMLIPDSKTSWEFMGSFTTPKCNRKVQWYLLQDEKTLSQQQLDALSQLFTGTYRAVQPW